MTRASRPMWEKRKVKNLRTAVRHLDRLLMSDCSSVVTVPVPSDLASETGHFLYLKSFQTFLISIKRLLPLLIETEGYRTMRDIALQSIT